MSEYSGTDKLEIMDDAVNYNAYLSNLVRTHALRKDSILDFGAGIGTFSIPLKRDGYDVSCVEPDLKQLDRIKQHGLCGFGNLSSVPEEAFDYIFTLNVLEHIENDREVLLELAGKLKPGGRLLIYVPAFQILFSSMDRSVGHFRRYSLRGLSDLVVSARFSIHEARYVDSVGFLASIVFKYLGSSDGTLNRKAVILFDRVAFPISRVLDFVTRRFFGKNLLLVATRM